MVYRSNSTLIFLIYFLFSLRHPRLCRNPRSDTTKLCNRIPCYAVIVCWILKRPEHSTHAHTHARTHIGVHARARALTNTHTHTHTRTQTDQLLLIQQAKGWHHAEPLILEVKQQAVSKRTWLSLSIGRRLPACGESPSGRRSSGRCGPRPHPLAAAESARWASGLLQRTTHSHIESIG